MGLRNQVLRGGVYLAIRQALGMCVSLVGVLLLTRTIGPKAYGLYASALGVYTYCYNLSQWGIDVYLIRQGAAVEEGDLDVAFTLFLLLGLGAAGLMLAGMPLLERWLGAASVGPLLITFVLALPLTLVTLVPLCVLERNLDYRRVALIELGGQISFYVVALPMAYRGLGAWAPLGGWLVQQLLMLVVLFPVARYRPRLRWNSHAARRMLSYGLSYDSSIWVWQLRSLVNPLLVGRFLGLEAVGYVALAIRLVDMLSFVKNATWRLSIAALARLQTDRAKLRQAVSEGMRLQVMALGPILVGFGLVGPWLFPQVFGPKWAPVMEIYPFVALGAFTNVIFNLHSSALYVLKHNWDVTRFHAVHVALFAGAAYLLIPRWGMAGYGLGEVAAILGYAVIHFAVVKRVGAPQYALPLIWWIGLALPLFWRQLGPWTWIGPALVLVWPGTVLEIRSFFGKLRGATAGG